MHSMFHEECCRNYATHRLLFNGVNTLPTRTTVTYVKQLSSTIFKCMRRRRFCKTVYSLIHCSSVLRWLSLFFCNPFFIFLSHSRPEHLRCPVADQRLFSFLSAHQPSRLGSSVRCTKCSIFQLYYFVCS